MFVLAVAGMAACVTGDADQEEIGNALTDSGAPRDARFPDDAGFSDAKPGTLFDVIDDAPCAPGTTATCKTACGTIGSAACIAGDYGPCKALPGDPCTGLDCTGKGDGLEHTYFRDGDGDGHGDPKSTTQACVAPTGYVTIKDDCDDARGDVHPGAKEVCDRVDNDCNGGIDEGLHVAMFDVSFASVPPCVTSDPASCKAGAHAFCKAKSACFDGGFGPVELGATNGVFVCVSGGSAIGSWAEATAAQPGCSSDSLAGKRVCESAVHRVGANKGYASAVLQTHAPGSWNLLAFPAERAQVFAGVSWGAITGKHAGCTLARVDAYDCNAAVHRYCNDKGFASGYGPVEYNTAELALVCVKP